MPRTCTLVFSRRFLAWSKSRRLERNLFTPVNSIENLKILWSQSYKALHKCSINYRTLIAAKFWWYCPQVFWFNNINFGDIILLHFPLQLGGNRRPNYLLVGMNSNLVGTNCCTYRIWSLGMFFYPYVFLRVEYARNNPLDHAMHWFYSSNENFLIKALILCSQLYYCCIYEL